jgi:hypothetical protein
MINWRNFGITIVAGMAIAAGLVLAFQRWPHLAQSPFVMFGLFLFALLCSRLMRRFIRK